MSVDNIWSDLMDTFWQLEVGGDIVSEQIDHVSQPANVMFKPSVSSCPFSGQRGHCRRNSQSHADGCNITAGSYSGCYERKMKQLHTVRGRWEGPRESTHMFG
jgi:hypothetical protein